MSFVSSALNRTVVITLAAVAIGGYAIGRSASSGGGTHTPRTRSVIVAGVLVEYPQEWSRTAAAQFAGLTLAEGSLFSPRTSGARAGLLIGSLPPSEAAPLARGFLRALSRPPRVTIVSVAEAQAYEYSELSVAGVQGSLTVYAIPRSGAGTTIAACYDPRGNEAFLARCGAVLAGGTLLGQAQQGFNLIPDPNYARSLAALVAQLEARRREVAAAPGAGASEAGLERLAGRLAAAYAQAASSLAALEAAPPAADVQLALVRALDSASSAFASIAHGVGAAGSARSSLARANARAAETLVNEDLERFSLLGYGSSAA